MHSVDVPTAARRCVRHLSAALWRPRGLATVTTRADGDSDGPPGVADSDADDENESVVGVITDGDLRRMMQSKLDYTKLTAQDIMSKDPFLMPHTTLAKEALILMQEKEISQIIVTQSESYIGVVHIHDILNEGIY